MKQVTKTLLLIGAFTLSTIQFATAQKSAHINLDEVVASMPEAKSMQSELEKLGKTYESEIKAAQNALKAKFERYTAEEKSKTPEENQARAIEIQQEEGKIQQLRSAAAQELQKKQNELLEPVIKKAQNAIKAYATESGIKYVFDARTLIYAEGEDISGAVKKKLGIQ